MRIYLLSICLSLLLLSCAVRQGGNIRGIDSGELAAKISFSGGSGESAEDAVIISGVTKQSEGLAAEYEYISRTHGEKNKLWLVRGQTILKEKTKIFDVIEIKLNSPDDDLRIYYFDVTSFPWKK